EEGLGAGAESLDRVVEDGVDGDGGVGERCEIGPVAAEIVAEGAAHRVDEVGVVLDEEADLLALHALAEAGLGVENFDRCRAEGAVVEVDDGLVHLPVAGEAAGAGEGRAWGGGGWGGSGHARDGTRRAWSGRTDLAEPRSVARAG